jgi:NitT/TauT family transport system substrate-binding protein
VIEKRPEDEANPARRKRNLTRVIFSETIIARAGCVMVDERKTNVRNKWIATIALTGLLMLTAGFTPATAQPAPGAGTPGAKQKVLIRFTWKLKGEYAPLFVALDKGFYAAEGLDIELAEGSGAETVVKVVGMGTDAIAYGPATVVAEAVNKGMPVEVVAVYQPQVPIALASFPDIPLRTPKDLEGRKLGVTTGETFSNLVDPFAKANSLDLTKVAVVKMESSVRAAQFMTRGTDITSLYLTNELPLFEKRAGVKFNVMKIADFGLKLLGASFIVNSNYAKANPETLRKLLRATAQGYVEAKKDPAAATSIMEKYMKVKVDRDILEQQVRATVEATPLLEGRPIGWQTDAEWLANLELLKASNAIQVIKDLRLYYTNDYLRPPTQ